MKHKILIFEDDQTYFEIIYNELSQYDVDIFPSPGKVFDEFSDSMLYYVKNPGEKTFNVIRDYVMKFTPDIVILDICFDATSDTDQSGKIIKSNLLDVDFPYAAVYYYSKRFKNLSEENMQINKSPYLHTDVKNKIVKVYGFSPAHPKEPVMQEQEVLIATSGDGGTGEMHSPSNSSNGHEDRASISGQSNPSETPPSRRKRIGFPESLSRWAEFERYKLSSWFSEVTDKFIIYIFYILIIISFALGGWRLVYSYYKYFDDLIHVAEYAFTAFLPLLIIVSLFALYKHSLRGYILDDPWAPKDIEEGSKLMMFSKKLFISSLASFLFLKMIEHINSYSDYGVLVFLTKLGSYFTGIFLLVGYYIYLNMSHGHKK